MGKHIPIRECICCRTKSYKRNLIRVVKNDDVFDIDESQKQSGRGAYICKECLNDSVLTKKRPLDRAFRQKVPEKIYKALEAFGKGVDINE